MKLADIIFVNDSARLVVIGGDDKSTKSEMGKLRKDHLRKEKEMYPGIDDETYDHRYIWHVKSAEYVFK